MDDFTVSLNGTYDKDDSPLRRPKNSTDIYSESKGYLRATHPSISILNDADGLRHAPTCESLSIDSAMVLTKGGEKVKLFTESFVEELGSIIEVIKRSEDELFKLENSINSKFVNSRMVLSYINMIRGKRSTNKDSSVNSMYEKRIEEKFNEIKPSLEEFRKDSDSYYIARNALSTFFQCYIRDAAGKMNIIEKLQDQALNEVFDQIMTETGELTDEDRDMMNKWKEMHKSRIVLRNLEAKSALWKLESELIEDSAFTNVAHRVVLMGHEQQTTEDITSKKAEERSTGTKFEKAFKARYGPGTTTPITSDGWTDLALRLADRSNTNQAESPLKDEEKVDLNSSIKEEEETSLIPVRCEDDPITMETRERIAGPRSSWSSGGMNFERSFNAFEGSRTYRSSFPEDHEVEIIPGRRFVSKKIPEDPEYWHYQ
ncbi:uncharacterized protein L201_007257 [Kwoniella dendrophila CBS 6074]|uniref:Uncharacterized protein n=1 Tax=Kwoniella dendrophila CBS 6074 TaxID=1295534 RepID=A0AAX4K576_9TREE